MQPSSMGDVEISPENGLIDRETFETFDPAWHTQNQSPHDFQRHSHRQLTSRGRRIDNVCCTAPDSQSNRYVTVVLRTGLVVDLETGRHTFSIVILLMDALFASYILLSSFSTSRQVHHESTCLGVEHRPPP